MWMTTRNIGTLLALLGLLWGCGSGSGTPSAATQHKSVKKTLSAAEAASLSMVNAVADPKGEPVPLQVKFQLRSKPQPSQPVDLDLQIVPVSGNVDELSGTVTTEDGMDLVDGGQIAAQERPPEGVAIEHTVKVLPKRDGIFTVTAQITVNVAGQANKETYSIPVIAGTGMPEVAKPPSTSPSPAAGTAAQAPQASTTASKQ